MPRIHAAALMLTFLLGASPGLATGVYGTSVLGELMGSRSVGSGLMGYGGYAGGFTVSWDIQMTGPGSWHYEYTFTFPSGSDISHFVLDLSDDCIVPGDPACVTDATLTDGVVKQLMNGTTVLSTCGDEEDQDCVEFESSSDGLTNAVKFEEGGGSGVMYEFDSNQSPVYGHLAIKSGGGSGVCPNPGTTTAACSNGLTNPMSMNTQDFVARPNGHAPEPGTALLIGSGLAIMAWLRRSRR